MSINAKQRRAAVERAAQAHSNLNVFYSIVALLEGGTIYGGGGGKSSRVAEQIIKICKAQCSHELSNYDREVMYATQD